MSYTTDRLGNHIEILSGYAYKSKDFVEKGIPVIKIKNVTPPSVSLEDLSYVPEEVAQKTARYILHYDDVLIALTGSHINQMASVVGRVARVKYSEKTVLNQRVGKIISLDGCDLDYVYYFLSQEEIKLSLASKAGGAANQANISPTDIKNLMIPFPDINIQRRISSILRAYDDLIETNQYQIKLLEEVAQRLYKTWFVDYRFPGYDETHIIDGVPKGWGKKSILDNSVFVFVKSKIKQFAGEKRYFATADVSGTEITTNGIAITFANRPSRAAIQPVKNSVWFARMSNSYKIINCFGESAHLADDSIISTGFAGFTAADNCYGFVYETIASKAFEEEKNRYATGATQVSLTDEGLKKIEVLIPTQDIILQYSSMVEPIMQKIEALKKQCTLLKQARDRLLPKLMSGEIAV